MTTLLEIHEQHFNASTGAFNKKPFAGMVAEQLLRFLNIEHSLDGKLFDSRNIRIEGKHTFVIEFPRIQHIWWPKANTKEAIEAEYNEVSRLFAEARK